MKGELQEKLLSYYVDLCTKHVHRHLENIICTMMLDSDMSFEDSLPFYFYFGNIELFNDMVVDCFSIGTDEKIFNVKDVFLYFKYYFDNFGYADEIDENEFIRNIYKDNVFEYCLYQDRETLYYYIVVKCIANDNILVL